MFYELNTLDPIGNNPWKREPNAYPNSTFAGQANLYSKLEQAMNPDAELEEAENIQQEADGKQDLTEPANENAAVPVPNILPDGYVLFVLGY